MFPPETKIQFQLTNHSEFHSILAPGTGDLWSSCLLLHCFALLQVVGRAAAAPVRAQIAMIGLVATISILFLSGRS